MERKIRVTIWNEFIHEIEYPHIAELYPEGIHTVLKQCFKEDVFETWIATLNQDKNGLTDELLKETDVLIWWGHMAHDDVLDETVERVYKRVLSGMGLIVLHSGAQSRIFRRLMGTSCDLKWREAGEKERVWVIEPGHPIAAGLPENFEIPHSEMYGERFDIPKPDSLVFISWYAGGEVFRSGCCYQRGLGRIFYFSPGHEEYPIYYQKEIQTVIRNAAAWAALPRGQEPVFGNVPPLEAIAVNKSRP